MLWLGKRWIVELSGSGGCFRRMYFEETLLDELFQVLLEDPVMDGLVSFTVMIGAILLCARMYDRTGLISSA